jgi:NADH-quinone oxidoreductase subunit M
MCILLLNQFNAGENISVIHQWINQPNHLLQADGLAIAMILLTLALTLSLYSLLLRMNIRMQSVLCSNPFMAFAMAGTFLASDGLLYYIFWELSLIPIYFIASFGVMVMLKNVKVKFFIYTLAGSLFMLIALFIYTNKQEVFY